MKGMSKEGARFSWMQGHLSRATIRGVCDPTAILGELLLGHRVFKFIQLNLANAHFLKMWVFWRPGSLKSALRRASITCSLFFSVVWMDVVTWPMWTLTTVPLGFPKAWSLDWGQHASHECPLERAPLERAVSRVP